MGGAEWEHECTNGQDREVRAGCQRDAAAPADSILQHHASVCPESNCEVTTLEWTLLFFFFFCF